MCVVHVNRVYVPSSVLIALSVLQGCRSQCCQHSPLLSFVAQMQLSWRPSGASWPPAAVSLSSLVSGLWPEGGGGGGPWVASLALEVGAASPGGRGCREGRQNISGKRQTFVFVCVCVPWLPIATAIFNAVDLGLDVMLV